MPSAAALIESFFVTQYHDAHLPPLWAVIYQEAIRGHHLLFKKEDIALFAEKSSLHIPNISDVSWSEELEDTVFALMNDHELSPMIRRIDELPLNARYNLFKLYQHALWIWSHYSKTLMN